jgi:hypothetical protein
MGPDLGEKQILNRRATSALAFFDIFKQPLTLMETCRWQYGSGEPANVNDVYDCLNGHCEAQYGLFSLPLASAEPRLRSQRYRLSERKFRRARRFAAFARLLPSVRLVAVGNSLAWSNAEEGSDIDIFLVTKPGTVWTTRLMLAAPLMLLRLRPTPQNQKDKLCLSFIVSQDNLDLSGLKIGPDDVYLSFWLAGLVPIYDAGNVMKELWKANKNLLSVLPGAYPRRPAHRRSVSILPSDKVAEMILDIMRGLEPLARLVQKWRFPSVIRSMANMDSRVVINDRVLKFHVDDRRETFSRIFASKLSQL